MCVVISIKVFDRFINQRRKAIYKCMIRALLCMLCCEENILMVETTIFTVLFF